MKKLLTFILTLIMTFSCINMVTFIVRAASSGDLSYALVNGGIKIIDCKTSAKGILKIPSTVNGYPVTSIGDYAFEDCDSLTKIIIPDSITSIGYKAFSDCDGLATINLPDNVTFIGGNAFKYTAYYFNNENWEDDVLYINNYLVNAKTSISGAYTIKEGTRIIAEDAFYCCSDLTSITIPDSVISIGESAFIGTAYYKDSNNWENNVLYIGDHLIKAKDLTVPKTYTIKEGTRLIADKAFYDCKPLRDINISDSVSYIGRYAFEGCINLTNITLPNSVTSICDGAFKGCISLTSINIPNNITSIRSSVFYNCSSLTSINIPNSVTSIYSSAFLGCGLTSINIPNSVTSICSSAFYNCQELTRVIIPDNVTHVGSSAFYKDYGSITVFYPGTKTQWNNITDCSDIISSSDRIIYNCNDPLLSLFDYTISNSEITITDCIETASGELEVPSTIEGHLVTSIGSFAFEGCDSLTSITIPHSVTSIGDYAFCDCRSLTNITIPDGVTSIGDSTFYYCSNLTSITIPDSVTEIGWRAFGDCYSLTTVYYTGTQAQWNAISIDSFNNTKLINANIVYNYKEVLYGDVNGDTFVNKKDDLAMRKYLADPAYEIDLEAANVFYDSAVNKKDLLRLKQHLADPDVVLGK